MAYTLYDASISTLEKIMDSLTSILTKAEKTADSERFFAARLHPEMFPFSFQIWDIVLLTHEAVAKSTGDHELPKIENNLASFEVAHGWIRDARAALAKVDKEALNAKAQTIVPMQRKDGRYPVPISVYLQNFLLPNIFFHLSTTYGILRKEGVDVGKKDYIDSFLKDYLKVENKLQD